MKPLRIFIGYDPRQPIAFNVLAHSISERASGPVSITKLRLNQLPIDRKGLTEFTFTRYLVPHLCEYEGSAIFMDADMLCLADVYELHEEARSKLSSVCVVKNKLRFEWPSLMHFNNALCRSLTPERIETTQPQALDWVSSLSGVGELSPEWNHLVGYDAPRPDAKIVHFTQGIPCFPETRQSEYAKEWQKEYTSMNSTVSWPEIMGGSVHAKPVMERLAAANQNKELAIAANG